jgi:hypothetical protein
VAQTKLFRLPRLNIWQTLLLAVLAALISLVQNKLIQVGWYTGILDPTNTLSLRVYLGFGAFFFNSGWITMAWYIIRWGRKRRG